MPIHRPEYDQDTAPAPMPGSSEAYAAAQASAIEREVDFTPGVDHDESSTDDFPHMGNLGNSIPDDAVEEDIIEILEPKAATKEWKLGPTGELTYYQRPLSFIAKMQWFSLLGELLDKAMTGNNAFSLADILQSPTIQSAMSGQSGKARESGKFNLADLRDVDMFIKVFGKLIGHSADFLTESILVWLYVPSHEREPLKEMLEGPEKEGGLSDDQGMEMIEFFIDQNWDALTGFFSERIGQLQKRVASKQEMKRRARR